MKNAPLKSARRRGLWKCGQGIRLAHSPTAEQNQKKRTNHVLPKPDNFIRYRQRNAYARGFKERLTVIVGGGGKRSDFCTICDFLPKMDFGKATASSPARSRSSRHSKSCSMLNNIEVALVAVVRMLRAVRPQWPTVCTRRSAEKPSRSQCNLNCGIPNLVSLRFPIGIIGKRRSGFVTLK
jgi:hypothetical protein